ncbi:hypothetical protein AYK20_04845 [Thermoplasmatales archaeon SG8-52-1]|nr:MAG: hypothetical protein AYK20_04845 [Thermoplasmatales archaeon SG8-52-1]
MTRYNNAKNNNYAVSEVVGGLLLVVIALISFSVIYTYFFYPLEPDYNTSVKIEGTVNDYGYVLLEHVGGNPLESYKIVIYYPNGTYIGSKDYINDYWKIGEHRYPLLGITNIRLINASVSLKISVYSINKNGKEQLIFMWQPCGKVKPPQTVIDNPMLISSLRFNTADEDLICFTFKVTPTSYPFNWDINMDFKVDQDDSNLLILHYGETGDPGWIREDINKDGIINNLDENILTSHLNETYGWYDWDINMDWKINQNDSDLLTLHYGETGDPGWIREDINKDGIVNNLDSGILYSHLGESYISYIFNWTINEESIFDLLMPFDTMPFNYEDDSIVRDYSGNEYNGTISEAVWIGCGALGGAYLFDGDNDYISIPYCYNDDYIDEITVEAWINTSDDNLIIASYDIDEYWELGIRNGVIHWSTSANAITNSITGNIIVNDNNWHHIVVSYDSNTGNSSIYVDGIEDKNENCHNPGEEIGSGSRPNGFIGTGNVGYIPGDWVQLTYDDFEDGFGNYTDGGRDCILYTDGTYAHQGSNAANIQDNSNIESSFYHTDEIDVDTEGYTSITVDFWFRAQSMESNEDFWVRYFDGSDWITVADYDSGDEFENGQFYHKIIWINETDYTFPSDMKIRFQCDASSDEDDIYIDQVYINASKGNNLLSNFSGIIDEFHIYNKRLSEEQVFQNYLLTRDGFVNVSVIVSDETLLGQIWRCIVTPNNGLLDGTVVESNSLQIIGYGGG